MPKVWIISPTISDDLITQLLFNRGIKTAEEKEKFFNPKLENYQKDLEIPGIKKAQDRIKKAIKLQELIIVYGDYDVDGITASAILYKALTSLGAKVLPYIPHREKEGYGLAKTGLDFARDSGASVVITVDNGIVALEQAKYAKSLGLDLIITDHHLPLDEKPEAFAIVHSTKMCGAAVAWCLIKDLVKEDLKKDLLQFVGIATVCDLIPLVGLGRAFAKEGLKVLNQTDNLGLLSLVRECGFEIGSIDSHTIGYIIGPRLNAIGRLEHAIDALRLLCTKDPTKAKNLAKLLCDANSKRQELTVEALDQTRLKVDKSKKIHILHSEDWSPGIIGLLAARVCEEYYRPAIALSVGKTVSKGSARSTNGINIVEVIRSCSDILIDVGGHKGAAGFSLASKNIKEFKNRVENLVEGLSDDVSPMLEMSEAPLQVEAEVEAKKLTKALVNQLEAFEPFGFGNPSPLFATKSMEISDIRTVGQGKHLKFKAENIDAIAFGFGEVHKELALDSYTREARNYRKTETPKADLAYFLEINKFNGSEILQLKIKDIKII